MLFFKHNFYLYDLADSKTLAWTIPSTVSTVLLGPVPKVALGHFARLTLNTAPSDHLQSPAHGGSPLGHWRTPVVTDMVYTSTFAKNYIKT